MNADSDSQRLKAKEKTSSLHQTKARYLQVIQDLTKDHQSVLQEKEQNSNSKTKSQLKQVSKSCSSIDLYNGNNSSGVEETPEEIRQYVKQFKSEVEEKFKKSESNRNYVFPKLYAHSSKMNGQANNKSVDNDATQESLELVSRYDLNSQNLKKKYALSGKNNGITDTVSDTGQQAEFLHDIGQQDKQFLESQLRDNKSHILKILCNTIKKKIITSEKSDDSYENDLEFQLRNQKKHLNQNNHNVNSTNNTLPQNPNIISAQEYKNDKSERNLNNSSSKNKQNKNVVDYRYMNKQATGEVDSKTDNNVNSPKSHQNLYELVEENQPEIHNYHHSPQRYHESKQKEDNSKNEHITSQKSLKKIKDQQVYTEGNYYPGMHSNSTNGGYDKLDSYNTEEPESSKGKMKVLTNLHQNSNVKNYQSPRKKTSATAHSKENQHQNNKRANQVSSRVKAHYYSKNVISPHRTHTQQSTSKNNNQSKKSNLTIFTNNTLTSTLSPKSNLSQSTFKSSSRGNTSKATNKSAKKSQLQFQVNSQTINKLKKLDDKSNPIPQQINGPIKSRIASKITAKMQKPKKVNNISNTQTVNNPHSVTANNINPVHLTIGDIKSINTSTKNSRYSSKSRRLNSGQNNHVTNNTLNQHSQIHNIEGHYVNNETSNKGLINRSSSHQTKDQQWSMAYKGSVGYMNKKQSDRDNNKGKAMLNKLIPQTHQKNMQSLSSVNWRKRLENLT